MNPPMADEDLNILIAIAAMLAKNGIFHVRLPQGAYFSNVPQNQEIFQFPGADSIRKAIDKAKFEGMSPNQVVLPTERKEKEVVGNIYGVAIVVDPSVPKDKFYIREEKHLTN